ncbi:glycolate oxidase [Syntrophus gentianae]|uniref:Glycolate oxidase n=1 Tax=Syntrophus gentianae TaxID=43775 RepID=A0A1H7WRJ2_9BACT|nr:FAD-linked oxidase C-terminal domain-containing protein [Syntrophus gentianae]SEM23599.1 glycolate oxidase [Syntrophus gentianae]
MESKSPFGKVSAEILAQLAAVVGENHVLTGDGLENYARDEMLGGKSFPPEVAVRPATSDEVSAILKIAERNMIPVTPRGSGTGLSGGAAPIYGGIVLSLERMNKILEIDRNNFTAYVEAGVTLADLLKAVAEQGLHYPIYPGESGSAIGGNVATNAGGMRAVKDGVTRNFVLGLEAVLPSGEIISTGGKYVKCSTAYDLTQLLIGTEGTMAVITRVLLKLVPPPGKTEILFIPFHSLHDAISCVPEILRQGLLPAGIEFMEQDIVRITEQYSGTTIPFREHEAFLLIIVEGANEDEIQQQMDAISPICMSNGAIDIFLPGTERAKRNLMEFREKIYYALQSYGTLDIADVVVPRSAIAEFVESIKQKGVDSGIPIITLGHAGDGNVHICLMGKDPDGTLYGKTKDLMKAICREGVALGGTISGEHGLGFAKRDYLTLAADESKVNLMKRIKKAFDPNGIMNPGKIFGED